MGDGREVYRALMQDLVEEIGFPEMARLIGEQVLATTPTIKAWYRDAYLLWLAMQDVSM